MPTNNSNQLNLEKNYTTLPATFYKTILPTKVANPKIVLFNQSLQEELGLELELNTDLVDYLSGNKLFQKSLPIAQAYAGHQFGHFTMLGDGRAILLGEYTNPKGDKFDIQLKGAGQTPYSRRGDGKATLKSMLREFLISEAMHYLGISSSRSLAVVKTGERVYREQINEGGVLTRIMKSHIRVGTFEYARYFASKEDLKALTDYTIQRYFFELTDSLNPPLELFEKVMNLQIDLVVDWMRVGFIHGVMNTDNTSITGETFDYGPCAFMNTYHPDTVYSSIDTKGRYSFINQSKIIKWNLAKLAETLVPLIHDDEEKAVDLVVEKLQRFDSLFKQKWYSMMCKKMGIENPEELDFKLVESLLDIMLQIKADYTQTYYSLSLDISHKDSVFNKKEFSNWAIQWKLRLEGKRGGIEVAKTIMKNSNPIVIPRNIHVERALEEAVSGDYTFFHQFLENLKTPYDFKEEMIGFLSYDQSYDQSYQTFCGT